jgi:hypothetical protein
MKTISITIEGTEYVLDLEKAKNLGVLKEDTSIKKIEIGDMYLLHNISPVIIVEHGFASVGSGEPILYNTVGLWGGLQTYSDFPCGATREEMLAHLNKYTKDKALKFIKNINDDFKALVDGVLRVAP